MTLRSRINDLYDRWVGRHDPAFPADGVDALPLLKIRSGKATSIGYFRDNNEDRYFVEDNHQVFIIADGMGGQAAGEQASQLAIDLISERLQQLPMDQEDEAEVRQVLRDAVVACNATIMAQGLADPSLQNMGTTIVVALVRGPKIYIAHVGDSRAYVIRENQVHTVTTDHNLAQALYEAKTISREELKTHKFRHVLWKYLGSKEAGDGPDMIVLDAQPGDRIVLATDGLTGVMEDESILEEVLKRPDPQKCADDLVQLSLDHGSRDNVTCVCLNVESA